MDLDVLAALDFFRHWFAHTEGMIELRSLGGKRPRRNMVMSAGQAELFMNRAHQAGEAIYFGVNTRKKGSSTGTKEDCYEAVGAHVDIDFKGQDPAGVRDRVAALPSPPSAVVLSGGGLHCYWRFTEPLVLESEAYRSQVEALNQLIVDKVGGDPAATDVSRILRPPGTFNTKRRQPFQVIIAEADWSREYELSDLIETFETLPDFQSPTENGHAEPQAENPFTEFGQQHARVDVDQLWAEMAPGNIHNTQCRIAFSMLNAGIAPDQVTEEIVTRTMDTWAEANWTRDAEEKSVKQLVADGLKKINAEKRQEAPPARTDDWPDPLNLLGDKTLTGSPRLDPGTLPKVIEEFAQMEAKRLGVDPVAVAAFQLATAAACIHDEFEVCIEPMDEMFRQKAILWVAQIAAPGSKKTDLLEAVTLPVARIEKRWRAEFREQQKQFDADTKKYKAMSREERSGWEEPQAPPFRRIIVNDATTEALRDILAEEANVPQLKLFSVQDELMQLISGFDAYKKVQGNDRSRWLQLYEGKRQAVERQGRPIPIEHWSSCLVGNLQPEKLREQGKNLATDGFLQRFMLIRVDDLAPSQKERVGVRDHHDNWAACIERLVELRPNLDNVGEPQFIRGTDTSYHCLQDIEALVKLARLMNWPEALQSAISKYTGLLARLCLVMQLVRYASGETTVLGSIEDRTVDMAAAWITNIVLPNHIDLFLNQIGLDDNAEHIAWICEHVLAHDKAAISVRDIGRAYRPLRGHPFKIEAAMQHLTDAGWVSEARKHGSRTSWSVNPKIYDRFAHVAAQEAQRRREVVTEIRRQVHTSRWVKSEIVPNATNVPNDPNATDDPNATV